jgi:hypothetical protein
MTPPELDAKGERALRLLRAAEEIANPKSPLGILARERLHEETGLGPEGIDLALDYSLEHRASRTTVLQLGRRLSPCPRSHVLLAGNVFVAAFRAILLGVLQADECFVRPSRRARAMTELLHSASGGVFSIVENLRPEPGDHLWAYGSDSTLDELESSLPRGVFLHRHGSGLALAAFVEPPQMYSEDELWAAISGLTTDIVLFDQRGCQSPRVVLIEGSEKFARHIETLLSGALLDAERHIPRGTLSPEEKADAHHYEAIFTYFGAFTRAGLGGITLDPEPARIVVPPVGRYLHLTRTKSILESAEHLAAQVTSFATFGNDRLEGSLLSLFGRRRVSSFGQFQRPALDGPVDVRPATEPKLLV